MMEKGLTVKYADRARKLKVTRISDHLCEYSNMQLEKFGIDEGVELEIAPDFVSEVVVDIEGSKRLLGYTHAMELIVGERRLTDLRPGEKGVITGFEGGYEDKLAFLALGFEEGKELQLVKFKFCYGKEGPRMEDPLIFPDLVPGEQYVLVENARKVGLPSVIYVLVETDNGEIQLPFMEKGDEGVIKTVACLGETEETLYDKLWIKTGSNIRMLYKEEPDDIPIRVFVEGKKQHIIGGGLASKIFVEYVE